MAGMILASSRRVGWFFLFGKSTLSDKMFSSLSIGAVCDVRSAWNGSGGFGGSQVKSTESVCWCHRNQLSFPLGSPWSAVQE